MMQVARADSLSAGRFSDGENAMTVRAFVRVACASVVVVLMTGPAQAGDEQAARRGPYLRLYSGVGVTGDSNLRIRQPSLGTDLILERVSWEHRSLTTDWSRDSIPYVGVRAGFFFREPEWLSLSFEVLHFKILAETEKRVRVRGTDEGAAVDTVAPMRQFVQTYQVTNGVNMILGNVQVHERLVRSARFADGRADIYGGLGAGVTIPYTRSTIDGETRGQYEWGRLATQVLGGFSWQMSRHWDISLEYKFTVTTVDGEVAYGDSRSRLHTHHLALGLGYHL